MSHLSARARSLAAQDRGNWPSEWWDGWVDQDGVLESLKARSAAHKDATASNGLSGPGGERSIAETPVDRSRRESETAGDDGKHDSIHDGVHPSFSDARRDSDLSRGRGRADSQLSRH